MNNNDKVNFLLYLVDDFNKKVFNISDFNPFGLCNNDKMSKKLIYDDKLGYMLVTNINGNESADQIGYSSFEIFYRYVNFYLRTHFAEINAENIENWNKRFNTISNESIYCYIVMEQVLHYWEKYFGCKLSREFVNIFENYENILTLKKHYEYNTKTRQYERILKRNQDI